MIYSTNTLNTNVNVLVIKIFFQLISVSCLYCQPSSHMTFPLLEDSITDISKYGKIIRDVKNRIHISTCNNCPQSKKKIFRRGLWNWSVPCVRPKVFWIPTKPIFLNSSQSIDDQGPVGFIIRRILTPFKPPRLVFFSKIRNHHISQIRCLDTYQTQFFVFIQHPRCATTPFFVHMLNFGPSK